ncbi:M20/M25/M40 family metallo-hydrolase [Selenihalanaerobacter shriftii]|nr:M20/M25/M40 family metallo-hydrolase [Selenihalanaerobacter shriftii]
MFKEENIVNKFIELTKIDSESGQERAIADKLKMELLNLGLEVNEDNVADKIQNDIEGDIKDNTGNIIAKLKGSDPELPTLLLSAHMDTVKPGQDVKPVIEDGTIFSESETILGADDKAGITMILTILRELKQRKLRYGDIEVVFTVCEEEGLLGSRNLAVDKLNADYGIVYDSGEEVGTIITEGPAQTEIKIIVKGKAAHAGREPYKGIDAIKIAGTALAKVNLGKIDEETTANIGIIKGGKATNIVPDEVELVGEVRSRDEVKLEKQIQHMIEIFKDTAREYGAEVEFEIERLFSPFKLNKDLPLIQLAIDSAKELDFTPELITTRAGSDANIFNDYGIPTFNFGLGTNHGHTPDENIQIENFTKIIKYSLNIIENLNSL